MRFLTVALATAAALSIEPPSAGAQTDAVTEVASAEGAVAAIGIRPVDPVQPFITLTTGRLLLVGGQRVVVTHEPGPAADVVEVPPAPPVPIIVLSEPPFAGAIWVSGHWRHGAGGFVWVDGRHIAPKPGHVFVPPRWAFVAGRHLFFNGFFVPHRVFVRSFFNTFHFSGDPTHNASSAKRDRGPYWPIGASGRIVGVPSSKGRGPYWPVGLGPPTVLNTRGGTIVGLPSSKTRR